MTSRYNNSVIFIIVGAAVLFYLPFIARGFLTDDWLWLANAKRASSNPLIFLERPMMGYFRPLNMVIVFLFLHLFGPTPWAFSLVNILLHAANIWLLWRLLGKFGISDPVRNLSAIFFGFYALNASAIEWISVGHDLWVTGLSLTFAMRVLSLTEKPSHSLFAQTWLLGFAAVLIKESGFVTIAVYFLILIYTKKSPVSREFRAYSIFFVVSYCLYLLGYFVTRTVADRDLELGLNTIVNIWYFVSYLVTPVSQRIAEAVPHGFTWALKVLKVASAIVVPVTLIYVYRKSQVGVRLMILWSVMFVSTIAIFKWNINPFSPFPDKTVSRFMYSAVPGMATAAAWLVLHGLGKMNWRMPGRYLLGLLVVAFVLGNLFITCRISRLFLYQQELSLSAVKTIDRLDSDLSRIDSLLVLTNSMDQSPLFVESGIHLQAMLYVISDCTINVSVEERANYTVADLGRTEGTMIIGWDSSEQRFVLPTVQDREESPGNNSD